jgi:NADH-quinone oxidoreductase subunit G
MYHVFGSEELSAHSDGIAELAPNPYLALNPKDGEKLEVEGGDPVELSAGGSAPQLAVKLLPELPPGIAGIPVGLAGVPPMELPLWARLRKRKTP